MNLNSLQKPRGQMTSRRVGRGGKRGKTSGRGGKGQTARAGNKRRPEWRDVIKKIPKRRGYGVNRSSTVRPKVPAVALNLDVIARHYENGATISIKSLIEKGLVRRVSGKVPPMKLMARGGIEKKFTFERGIMASAGAKAAIEKAGGTLG
jgi:large subunit ribosomal protein L15